MSVDQRVAGACMAVLVMAGAWMPAVATDFDRGRALYDNHCRVCHEDWAHTRDGRRVNSFDELRARVASWSVHSGLQWDTEEIDEVTRYLNRRFYQLTP